MKNLLHLIGYFLIIGIVSSCNNSAKTQEGTNSLLQDQAKETFSIQNLVEQVIIPADSIMQALHAQHHSHKVLAQGSMPLTPKADELKYWKDHAVALEDLPVIFPGPGEYVHVMEGYKYGYNNLVIGITETFPGGAPPMHTHEGEESHVLLEGEILYALGDTLFTMKAPFIVNIPPMVPHAFKNVGEKTANLVVIFPTNVWVYDVVDFFPFEDGDNE